MNKTHIIYDVRSDLRTTGSSSSPHIISTTALEFEKASRKKYATRFENIVMPTSFYQISSNFNNFRVAEFNGVTTNTFDNTIPVGNYSVAELASEMETQLNANTVQGNTYVIVISEKTGKYTVSYSGGASTTVTVQAQNDATNPSTLNPIAGFGEFNSSTTTPIAPAGTEAPNFVNLTPVDYITLSADLASHNHFTKNKRINVGVRIPISEERNDKVFVNNHEGAMIRYTGTAKISDMTFDLRDPYNNVIDLNGVPFSTQIVFYELPDL